MFPVKTLIYPDGHEWFRVESGILHADAAQYKTFNSGLEFRIGTVELKGDYLELKLPCVIEPKQSAVVKLMLGSGWQKTMTNEAVLKMADRFLSDRPSISATIAAKAQPPASQNNTTDASQSPEQPPSEANQAKANVGGTGTDAGSLEAGLAAEKRGDWKAAFLLLEPLAKQGNADAQTQIGFMYETGRGVWHGRVVNGVTFPDRFDVQDGTVASVWYRKAADQGNAQAEVGLGECQNTL